MEEKIITWFDYHYKASHKVTNENSSLYYYNELFLIKLKIDRIKNTNHINIDNIISNKNLIFKHEKKLY